MLATKSIGFRYDSSDELSSLMEDFRLMCNDAIRIALDYEKENGGERVRNRFKLIKLAYLRLKEYGLHSHYILSACEVAYSAYRNKSRKSRPYIKRGFVKLTNQSYLLNHLILRIPTRPRHFIFLTLRATNYQLSLLENPLIKRGSVTVTLGTASISVRKEIAEVETRGKIGIDLNEKNITWSDSEGRTERADTSEVAELKERYREIRSKIARRVHNDMRLRRRLLSKYGKRERDTTIQQIHRTTKRIVEHAKTGKMAIVMEKLKGIRKLYHKGNGQGPSYRGRLNTWTFREIQRQVEYKANWDGIPVTYVNPRGTSSRCPGCGSSLTRLLGRKLLCPHCNKTEDRDAIASRNIMACVVPQARPSR
ncbi:MAG TPA: transposase [Nitrososphaerales archaeon]|nr:transposase [Nitrososphaerales archaeon]